MVWKTARFKHEDVGEQQVDIWANVFLVHMNGCPSVSFPPGLLGGKYLEVELTHQFVDRLDKGFVFTVAGNNDADQFAV